MATKQKLKDTLNELVEKSCVFNIEMWADESGMNPETAKRIMLLQTLDKDEKEHAEVILGLREPSNPANSVLVLVSVKLKDGTIEKSTLEAETLEQATVIVGQNIPKGSRIIKAVIPG